MSVVVNVASQESLDRATRLLAGVAGGVEKAVKAAMSRTTSHMRTAAAEAIRERYAISKANIRTEENVKVRYAYQDGGVQATVTFSGHKIPLYRYDGTSPKVPTAKPGKTVAAMLNGQWSQVRPGMAASGHQLKGTSPTQFENAFIARMKSGHTGIFERTGGVTSAGGDEIHEIMGSSVAQMLGNEEVQETLARQVVEKFEQRMDHEILRVLNGWGG